MRQLLAAVLVLGAATVAAATGPLSTAGLRLNQLQVIGSHNSYKRPIDAPMLRMMTVANPRAAAFDYSHPPLNEQLDLGLRALELDVYYDPVGGLYANPLGLEFVRRMGDEPAEFDPRGQMKTPGFKVLHVADVDFRSSCPTLEGALAELRAWSERNPNHLPVVVTMNVKDEAAPIPNATQPAPIDAAALDLLDAAIAAGLGVERLITPDLVRGESGSLEAAVLKRGWPKVDDVRGRYLWVIDETGAKRQAYVEGHASLRGRRLFTTSEPGAPEAAVLVLNDPLDGGDEIRRRVEQGYLVRTRADAETAEARAGDRSRCVAAQASGAQVISTDYPRPDKRFGTGYSVSFEGGAYARRNPVTALQPSASDDDPPNP